MQSRKKNILITGPPGCGKTTVIMKAAALLQGRRIAGFYTEEIRENHSRLGFRIITFSGTHGVLAHVGFTGVPRKLLDIENEPGII